MSRHYRSGLTNDGGLSVLWEGVGSAAPTVHVQLRGEAFGSMDENESLEVCRYLASAGYKPSRLDICRDVDGLDLNIARSLVLDGQVRKSVQETRWNETLTGKRRGATLYVGSRTSAAMLRAYDRGELVRLEVELHDERAQDAYRALVGGSSVLGLWRSAVLALADFPTWPAWGRAVESDEVAVAQAFAERPLL